MANKIRFNSSVTPIEDNTNQFGSSNFISESECYGTVTGNGEISSITIESSGGSNDGYVDGAQYYAQGIVVAEGSVTPGSHGFVNLASADLLAIKHTGFQYSSTSALSTTVNTTDYLSVMVNAGAGTDICIARLKAGESIVLPARGGLATNNIMIASTNGSGSAGANTIGVEFLAFT